MCRRTFSEIFMFKLRLMNMDMWLQKCNFGIYENWYGENHTFLWGCKLISTHTVPIYCPLWVKFGIIDLHLMLLNISELYEN